MCGIVGIVSLNGNPINPTVLQQMNDRQTHRGPDGAGFLLGRTGNEGFQHFFVKHTWQWTEAPFQIALGHRRLSILDLSERGLQPMTIHGSEAWIAFNGEIYNHIELREELQGLGYSFTTRTDTEVLLQAYLHWGEQCLEHLEGMFAFAIWDGKTGKLFCARDRLGIKPFYYAMVNGHFIFASEIKALLAFPGLSATPDDDAVLGFLIHGNCDYGARTTLRNVLALPASHFCTLSWATGHFATRRYWKLDPAAAAPAPGNDRSRIQQLRELLVTTMRRHLISDVRAGSCLSGGLDSSAVVGLMGQIQSEDPAAAAALGDNLFTFTSCYEDKEIDERQYALAVADVAAANPHLVFPTAEDFWQDFERLAWHQDMPFCGLSYYAQWRVMRAAKETGVKVLLDGQGGDEVFGGYAKFRYAYMADLLRTGHLFSLLRELGGTIRQGDRYVLDIRKGYRYLPSSLRRFFKTDSVLKPALRADWDQAVSAGSTPATRWWQYASGQQDGHGQGAWTAMQRIQADDLLMDTLPLILRHEDRSSMAFSIEARVPLLDHRLVEFGVFLPDRLKFQNGWSKFAIREAIQGLVPEAVRLRKKKLGFAAPDRRWMVKDLRGQVNELIGGNLRCQKYIDPAPLRRWYNSPEAEKANTESYLGLFRVLALEMWMRAFSLS